ncbi:MAG: metal ABC transporter ATP-binding protein [Gammaproteobacteria bacterium]
MTTCRGGALLIRIDGLSIAYGGTVILSEVNLVIDAGDRWFLVGPNGSGKSSLLNAMLGLLPSIKGQVWRDPARAGADRIGFVPQRCDFNPSLPTTVREFVRLGLCGIRITRAEEAERIAWSLAQVDLPGMERRDYWSLSGGQRQRALVARALARRPSLLVLDEPTGGMDLIVEARLMEHLAELNRDQHLTVVCVTHDLGIAEKYGSHVCLVANGGVMAGVTWEMLQSHVLAGAFSRLPTPGDVSV